MLQTSNLPEGKHLPMRAGIRHINLLLAAIIILMSTSLHLQAQQLPAQNNPAQQEHDEVFIVVEHPAEFPGGAKAFHKFLGENIHHTQGMVDGRVFLQFVVRKDGSLTDIKAVRGENELNKAEAARVMKLSPKWQPGMQNGRIVNQQFTVPITFTQS